MSETRNLLEETANKVFSDCVTAKVREHSETGDWQAAAWNTIEASGLTRAFADEDAVSWADAYVLFRASGAHRVPLPFVETLIAGWLLHSIGVDVPEGPISLAAAGRDSEQPIARVPWGRHAEHLVVVHRETIKLFNKSQWKSEAGHNMARHARDQVMISGQAITEHVSPLGVDIVQLLGALARSAQIAGALDWVLAASVDYTNDRVQFGRALGKFQAIQQQLAVLATEAAAADHASLAAFTVMDTGPSESHIAIAKTRAGEAAGVAAGIAHQVHGAIGFTKEHALHTATRCLWSWRTEFGAERYWSERLGRAALTRGSEQLWPMLATV